MFVFVFVPSRAPDAEGRLVTKIGWNLACQAGRQAEEPEGQGRRKGITDGEA